MSAPKGYSITQIRLHWIVAGLIVLQLIFGEGIKDAIDIIEDGGSARYDLVTVSHIAVGVLVLAFAVWRLALRARRGVPALPAGSVLQHLAAHAGHWALYALMVLAPISGMIAWFGGIEDVADLHELAKPAFVFLIAVHVVAALWHQFWLKDGLLVRMKRPAD